MTTAPIVGADLLRLITGGMYGNPLVLYREYLQNASDSIASQGLGSVQVKIDRLRSRIVITDDGGGLSPEEAAHRLIDVGRSTKDRIADRGFRGIGRLCGLAFAEQVEFTTRTRATEPVTQVTWSGTALRAPNLTQTDAATAIDECTTIRQVPDGDWPDRFFMVTVDRINRHAASVLLNEDAVRRYIGEVCPVPMPSSFPLANEVREFLDTYASYFVLRVRLNDDDQPVERPFAETIPLNDRYGAVFERLETRVIPGIDGAEPAAIVWLAHTPYAGSIPSRLGVRGLRARVGNIQIGTDRTFEHLFLEPRFNGWCVGEVHVLDRRLLPNGQRDYFEPGPHLRNIENHLGALALEISRRCRQASSQRNKLRKVGAEIHRLRRARELALSGYLCSDDATALVVRERQRIPGIKHTLSRVRAATSTSDQDALSQLEDELNVIDVSTAPPLRCVPPNAIATVQAAFGAIAETMTPNAALGTIETILGRLSRSLHR